MSAISKALELIKAFEGCKLRAYLCPAGVPTIGWGATGADVRLGMVWTQDQADNRLLTDVARFTRGVSQRIQVTTTDGQLGACISLAYNIGLGNFAMSTLLRLLNGGDFTGASAQFMRWDKAGGKRLAGLTRRRAAERACFDGG